MEKCLLIGFQWKGKHTKFVRELKENSQTWRLVKWLSKKYYMLRRIALIGEWKPEAGRGWAVLDSCGEGGAVCQLTPCLLHINPNHSSTLGSLSSECQAFQGGDRPASDPNLGKWRECLCLLSGHFPTAWERLQIGGLAISRGAEEGIRAGTTLHPITTIAASRGGHHPKLLLPAYTHRSRNTGILRQAWASKIDHILKSQYPELVTNKKGQ